MKTSIKILLLSLFIFNGYLLSAQDIIILKTGKNIEATVLEIGLKEIKYKAFNNLEGPIITIKKSSVKELIYANGTHDIINITKSDSVSKHKSQITHSIFFISPNIRILTVPTKLSRGLGFTFGVNLYSDKSYDLLGVGIEYYSIIPWYRNPPSYRNPSKHVSIFLSNKFFFSNYSRSFKPYLLTDIGWSKILNKQELKTKYIEYNNTLKFPENTDNITTRDGVYLKPGFGIDYSFKHNSFFTDLCFDMNFTPVNIYSDHSSLLFFGGHDEFFLLFRLGYIYRF